MGFDSTLAGLGINRATGTSTPTVNKTNTSSQMDQSDFLTLMTAQLKNQDPFEPVDNTQMVAQMAQFSSLAGISEMNSTLRAIADRLNGSSPNEAVAWIGRTVLTEGKVAYPNEAGGVDGAIELDEAASEVTITVKNPDGTTLRTVSLGAQDAGTVNYSWDGSTETGEPAGDGPFTIAVTASGAEGGKIAARNLVWAPVGSVTIGSDGSPILSLPGIGQVPVTAVRKIG